MQASDLIELLLSDGSCTVLTPNRRLAAVLLEAIAREQNQKAVQVFETPDVLSINQWLVRLFQEQTRSDIADHPLLLTASQERFLWEKIIRESKQQEYLLQLSETAALAESAWALLQQWQIPLSHAAFDQSEDARALHEWLSTFDALLKNENWLDEASLPTWLSTKLSNTQYTIPLVLLGFTELTPQWQAFFSRFTQLSRSDFHQHIAKMQRAEIKDHDQELMHMAHWAKTRAKQHPEARIACVLPNLEKERDRVWQIFSECFADTGIPVNLSAGRTLSCYPLIRTALQLLNLNLQAIPIKTWQELLCSPFFAESESEQLQRLTHLEMLSRGNYTHYSVQEATQESRLIKLSKRLQDWRDVFVELPQQQSFYAWGQTFANLLTLLGWPGERSINSEEYQLVERWFDVLQELARLDQMQPSATYSQALRVLQQLADRNPFQPQSPAANVQILGMLEASGVPFDHVWVSGLDDLAWPPAPKPHPFIPKSLQRELNMPHATAARELAYCQQLLAQWQATCQELIVSSIEKRDEVELQPSPLIRHFPLLNLPALPASCIQQLFASRDLENWEDHEAPPMDTSQSIPGGSDIIKQQALCPFRAFVKWRLRAQATEDSTLGLRAKDRGNLIHHTLELIWLQLKTQHALLQMDEASLQTLIRHAIETAIEKTAPPGTKTQQLLRLEAERLQHLLRDWLEHEKQREPFTVLQQESKAEVTIGPLTVSLRIDRIDELANGKRLIIDYKTARYLNYLDWFDARIQEPQLPIYALVAPEQTSGIAFAQVNISALGYKGVSAEPLAISGVKVLSDVPQISAPDFSTQIQTWLNDCSELAFAFTSGKANPDPIDATQTCAQCDYKPICRIRELQG